MSGKADSFVAVLETPPFSRLGWAPSRQASREQLRFLQSMSVCLPASWQVNNNGDEISYVYICCHAIQLAMLEDI